MFIQHRPPRAGEFTAIGRNHNERAGTRQVNPVDSHVAIPDHVPLVESVPVRAALTPENSIAFVVDREASGSGRGVDRMRLAGAIIPCGSHEVEGAIRPGTGGFRRFVSAILNPFLKGWFLGPSFVRTRNIGDHDLSPLFYFSELNSPFCRS